MPNLNDLEETKELIAVVIAAVVAFGILVFGYIWVGL